MAVYQPYDEIILQFLSGRALQLGGKTAEKRMTMRTFIIAVLLLGLSNIIFAENSTENIIEVEAKGSYLMGDGDSKLVARQLALFEAKKNALESAWRYISPTKLTLHCTQLKKTSYIVLQQVISTQRYLRKIGSRLVKHSGVLFESGPRSRFLISLKQRYKAKS